MNKKSSLIFLPLIFAALACVTSTPQPGSELVSETMTAPKPQASASATSLPSADDVSTLTATEGPASLMGLRIVYLRAGNLLSWTEAGGVSQLTDTGDMSTIRVSADGQLLAFMRGNEIWTVRMDGTDARLLGTQTEAGGALWFSPSGNLLAISTKDHIDIIDLITTGKTTVLKYQSVPDDFFPEVIWSQDSTGFKTVIPAQDPSGQAEFYFVFVDGTIASLAKFVMVTPAESKPFLSPDGGYVIYAAKLGDDKESLYLMDSSGATKPYGKPAESIRAYGWLPDSRRFVYGEDDAQENFQGDVGGSVFKITSTISAEAHWINERTYITIENRNLFLGFMNGANLLIDNEVTDFDVVSVN